MPSKESCYNIGKNCCVFFNKYLVPHVVLTSSISTVAGMTGAEILKVAVSEEYKPIEMAEVTLINGFIFGAIAAVVSFVLENIFAYANNVDLSKTNFRIVTMQILFSLLNMFLSCIVSLEAPKQIVNLTMDYDKFLESIFVGGIVDIIPISVFLCCCYAPAALRVCKNVERFVDGYRQPESKGLRIIVETGNDAEIRVFDVEENPAASSQACIFQL